MKLFSLCLGECKDAVLFITCNRIWSNAASRRPYLRETRQEHAGLRDDSNALLIFLLRGRLLKIDPSKIETLLRIRDQATNSTLRLVGKEGQDQIRNYLGS